MKTFKSNSHHVVAAILPFSVSLVSVSVLFSYYNTSVFLLPVVMLLIAFQLLIGCHLIISDGENNRFDWGIFPLLILTCIYIALRWRIADFSFTVGDASAYTWDGVYQSLTGKDSGFFPPLAAATSAIGFKLFGLSGVAIIFVVWSFVAVPLLYLILTNFGICRDYALIAVTIFIFSPLHIWFSKTTFSESIWQLLVLSALGSLVLLKRPGLYRVLSLITLLLIALTAPFGRGTAIFFVAGIIACVFSIQQIALRHRFYIVASITLCFLISFWISLDIRAPYLIGWQFSRILPEITPAKLLKLVIGGFVVGLSGLAWFASKVESKNVFLYRLTLLIALVLLKVLFAYVYHLKSGQNFLDLFFLNEIQFTRTSFSEFGVFFLAFGLICAVISGVRGNDGLYHVIVFYIFFSIPLSLQSIGVTMGHEMLLYWHRYYFSELFCFGFLFVAFASYKSIEYFRKFIRIGDAYRTTNMGLVVFFCVFISTQNYAYFYLVQGHAYLSGSAAVFTWIKNVAGSLPVHIYLNDRLRYSGYDGPFLLRDLSSRFGLNLKEIRKGRGETDRLSEGIVICSQDLHCNEHIDGYKLGNYSGHVPWIQHTFNPISPKVKVLSVDLEAYFINPIIQVGTLLVTNQEFLEKFKILGEGWHQIEESFVWSKRTAELKIPIPSACEKINCEIKIIFDVFGASIRHPTKVGVNTKGIVGNESHVYVSNGDQVIANVPIYPGNTFQNIIFDIPEAVSPKKIGQSSDDRVLGICLRSIQVVEVTP